MRLHPDPGRVVPPLQALLGGELVDFGSHARELHRTGTLFLLHRPGVYRDGGVNLQDAHGNVVYSPPTSDKVDGLMDEFASQLQQMWGTASPIEVTAFCLWRIKWVHPFKNGNGRTARAFAYACLCLKVGFLLPGSPTVIDLIMGNKPEYEQALRTADESYASSGLADLSLMESFVEKLLIEQLASVPNPT